MNELITTFIILFMSISTLEMDKVVVPSKTLVIIQFDPGPYLGLCGPCDRIGPPNFRGPKI